MNIKQLENKGISFMGDFEKYSKYKEKTIIVVGVARGGTSMVSGSLYHLGIFSGTKAVSPVFEDTHLSSAIESNDITKVKEIIEEYNKTHALWAYKRPNIINYLSKLHQLFRNPIYLFIFKDIASIAERNSISMKTELIKNLMNAQSDYQKIVNFIQDTQDLEGLILSYEKLMQNKDDFLTTLIKLLDNDKITEECIREAKKFIEPNPAEYLDKSRVTKGKGVVDQISSNSVSGWACYLYNTQVTTVELFINEKKVAETQANIYRKDLEDKSIHPTGICGFNFVFPDRVIATQDKIFVKIKDEVHNLTIGKKAQNYFSDSKIDEK